MAIATLLRDLFAERVLADDQERLAAYRRAWQAYYGAYPDPLPVSARAGLPAEDNVKLNYARLIVDKSVHALFGQPPIFDLDSQPGERTPAEQWLDQCLAANNWPSLLLKLATNGAVCGHAYIKLLPDGRGQSPGQGYPRLINLSPEYVTVGTDPDDVETAIQYTIEWTSPGEAAQPIHHRELMIRDGQRWQIIDEQAEGAGQWHTLSAVAWPHPWPPIHDCQNLPQANLYYGLPDLTPDLLDLIQAVNYVASNIVRITRHHAHPRTWGRGFRAQDMKLAVNEIMVLPSENAELRNLEMLGNLAFSHKTLDALREILHELAAIPEVTSGKLENIGPLSGVALGILYSPLIDRTDTKRATYGPMLESLARHLLELSPLPACSQRTCAVYGGGDQGVRATLAWPDIGPSNQLEKRQLLLLEQQLGVSQDTILTRLGYDPAMEKGKAGSSNSTRGPNEPRSSNSAMQRNGA
jgi:hypothetical protein